MNSIVNESTTQRQGGEGGPTNPASPSDVVAALRRHEWVRIMQEAADLIEQQAARIAELEAENARLKMVPMKYRRMEFNAALQKKLDALTLALETENAAATRYAQQVAHWIEKYDALRQRIDDATGKNDELHKQLKEQEGYDGIAHDMERLRLGLENCRLLAARHRKEAWALLILGFCAEAGVAGGITR